MSGNHVIEDEVFKEQSYLSDAFRRERQANQDERRRRTKDSDGQCREDVISEEPRHQVDSFRRK